MVIWNVPSIETVDGMKVSIEERQNAETYFMDQGEEPVFQIFEGGHSNQNYSHGQHQHGAGTPSLSTVLTHGYKGYSYTIPTKNSSRQPPNNGESGGNRKGKL